MFLIPANFFQTFLEIFFCYLYPMLLFTQAKGLHYLLNIVESWKQKYHQDKMGDLVLQNKELMANVKLTNNGLHEISKHSRGFENIPDVVMHPDECWGSWQDPKTQRVVLRNYIKFGKVSYLVQTKDGIITDAFAVNNASCNKFRKGIPLIS